MLLLFFPSFSVAQWLVSHHSSSYLFRLFVSGSWDALSATLGSLIRCRVSIACPRLVGPSIWSLVAAAHPLPLNDSLFHRARSVSSPPEPSIRQYQNSSHCRRCLRESPSFRPHTIQGSILFSPCGRVEVGNPFSSGWAASKAV